MITRYINLSSTKIKPSKILEPAKILYEGGLVAFPTETVYGLGANALNIKAIARIFAVKGRPSDNPLIVHISDRKVMKKLVYEITPTIQTLMDEYWPGPLTIIAKKTNIIPDITTGNLKTIAVRLPASPIACKLISLAGVPIAAPSANLSGKPSSTCVKNIFDDLDGKIEYIIDGGKSKIGLESTIIDCTTFLPTLLRPGAITLEMLIETLGEVMFDEKIYSEKDQNNAPGMKYKHYNPAVPMILYEGLNTVNAINNKIMALVNKGMKVGAIISKETAAKIIFPAIIKIYGSKLDQANIASVLYDVLRDFDDEHVDIIIAEGISEDGIGLAIMNRLRKAANYHIIKC